MAEVLRGEDMGEVMEVNNPPGTSWLRFIDVLPGMNIPVQTADLEVLKGELPLKRDFYMAGVNYMAHNPSELGLQLLRFVKDLRDI